MTRSDLDPAASGGGLVDLRTAVQQEVFADPALLSFGSIGSTRGTSEIERVVRVHNASTRSVVVSIGRTALAPKGVELTVDPARVRLRPGSSAAVVVRADVRELSGELVDAAEQALRNADRLRADAGTRLHELVRAVAADEDARTALAAGRLSQEPEPTGFEALGVLGEVAPARRSKETARERKAQEARERREAERREQVERLEAELAEAEREAAEARRAAEAADRRVETVRRSLERLAP